MTAADLRYLLAIDAVAPEGGATLTAVAQNMSLSKVSVYRAAARLEKTGLLLRDDRSRLHITSAGATALQEYRTAAGWLACHLEHHCGVDAATALQDAIGAVCAMSDAGRHGLSAFIHAYAQKENEKETKPE